MHDLAPTNKTLVAHYDGLLRSLIDYPAIAEQVESYNKESFVRFRDALTPEKYNETMTKDIRWSKSWSYDSDGAFAAIAEWLKTPNNTFEWSF